MIKVLCFAAVILSGIPANATSYKVSPGSTVQFLARITGGSFIAKTEAVRGSVQHDASGTITSGSIVVNADALETGMTTRDAHMRDKYLETDRYPIITLDLTGGTLPPSGLGQVDIDGTLEIHGKKRPTRFHVVIADAGAGARLATSSFHVDITEFGIAQPKFAVVKMDTTVDVSVELHLANVGN